MEVTLLCRMHKLSCNWRMLLLELKLQASDEAAGAAGSEPAIHEAADNPLDNDTNLTADNTARTAASTCLEDADSTGAANAETVSLAVATKQTSIHSSPCSIPKAQTTRVASDMQAGAASTSPTQVSMAIQQASCAAPDGLPCTKGTLTLGNEESASQKAGKSVSALISDRVKHLESSRVDNTAVKQSQNNVKHYRSLHADAFPAPKAVQKQTIPKMFQKKRKVHIVELAHQLHKAKKPCVEVIDLVSDDEPITLAASDTPSRYDFGSGHNKAEVIVIDGDLDEAGSAASAGAVLSLLTMLLRHNKQHMHVIHSKDVCVTQVLKVPVCACFRSACWRESSWGLFTYSAQFSKAYRQEGIDSGHAGKLETM